MPATVRNSAGIAEDSSIASFDVARMEYVRKSFEKLELPKSYLTVFLGNPSRDLPYHGNRHQIVVASLALRGANIHQLSLFQRRAVFLAGLFHDYGYSLERSEADNIDHAASFAWAVLVEDPILANAVERIIRETIFPHIPPSSFISALVQDADSLMISQPDFAELLEGLSAENPERVIDPFFPGENGLSTEWAKRLYRTSSELFTTGRRILDHDSAITVGGTFHVQGLSSKGFLVDESILVDLEAVWSLGYTTSYSCGGDFKDISPGRDAPMEGYIAFTYVSKEQLACIRSAAGLIGRIPDELISKAGVPTVIVRFDWADRVTFFETLIDLG